MYIFLKKLCLFFGYTKYLSECNYNAIVVIQESLNLLCHVLNWRPAKSFLSIVAEQAQRKFKM